MFVTVAVLPAMVAVGVLTGSEVVNETVIVFPSLASQVFVLSEMIATLVAVGAIVSCTVTLKEAFATLEARSVALQRTAVSPYENADPEVGLQSTDTEPSTSSFAVGFV